MVDVGKWAVCVILSGVQREDEEELSTAAISKQTKKGWQVDGKKQSGAPTFN